MYIVGFAETIRDILGWFSLYFWFFNFDELIFSFTERFQWKLPTVTRAFWILLRDSVRWTLFGLWVLVSAWVLQVLISDYLLCSYINILATCILLLAIVFIGTSFESKMQIGLLAILMASIVDYFFGIVVSFSRDAWFFPSFEFTKVCHSCFGDGNTGILSKQFGIDWYTTIRRDWGVLEWSSEISFWKVYMKICRAIIMGNEKEQGNHDLLRTHCFLHIVF